jgi:hypothetical protein
VPPAAAKPPPAAKPPAAAKPPPKKTEHERVDKEHHE